MSDLELNIDEPIQSYQIRVGQTVELQAVVIDALNVVLIPGSPTWFASDNAIVSLIPAISADGIFVLGLAEGVAIVTLQVPRTNKPPLKPQFVIQVIAADPWQAWIGRV